MANHSNKIMLVVVALTAVFLSCEMPWDNNDDGSKPETPIITNFSVKVNTLTPNSSEASVPTSITVHYDRRDANPVRIQRRSSDSGPVEWRWSEHLWHGSPYEDTGYRASDENRFAWGETYYYRIRGTKDNVDGNWSDEVPFTVPNFHAPRNVTMESFSDYGPNNEAGNEIRWDRIAIDQDSTDDVTYILYGKDPYNNTYSKVSSVNELTETTVFHPTCATSDNPEHYSYKVRAKHPVYGKTHLSHSSEVLDNGSGDQDNGDEDNGNGDDGNGDGDNGNGDGDNGNGDGDNGNGDGDNGSGDNGIGVSGENELTIDGSTYVLGTMFVQQQWQEETFAIYLAAPGATASVVNDFHDHDYYVQLMITFPEPYITSGTYTLETYSLINVGGQYGNYYYVDDGSVTITVDGSAYTIEGTVDENLGNGSEVFAVFHYEGTRTGDL